MIALALLLSAGLTLRDVQERARSNDPRIAQVAAQLANAQAKRDEVRWALFPTFDYKSYIGGPTPEHILKGGSGDPEPTNPGHLEHLGFWDGQLGVQMHADVQTTIPLFTFGKYTAGKEAAGHLVAANEALLQRARDLTTFDAARAYWGYQTARDAGDTAQKIHDKLEESKTTADRLMKEGSDQINKMDRLKLDYLAEQVEALQAGALKNRDLAIFGIRALLGLKAEDPLDVQRQSLPEPPPQPASEQVLKLALERRPEMLAAAAAVKGRQALVDLEQARFFPDLGIIAGASWTDTTNASSPASPFAYNPYNGGGVYAALGLKGTFAFPQQAAKKRQAEADLAEAQALLAGAERLVRLEVQQALGDLNEARTKAERFTRQTALGRSLAVQAAVAFDSGLGETRELLEDTLLYAYADGARLGALFDAQMAWAALEKAAGGPIQ